MFGFLKRLMGKSSNTRLDGVVPRVAPEPSKAPPPFEEIYSGKQTDPVIQEYFELHQRITAAQKTRDYRTAVAHCRETYRILPRFVSACEQEYGRWDISSSVAVHTGSKLMAVIGDREGIEELRQTLLAVPELQAWMDVADQAKQDVELVDAILRLLSKDLPFSQQDLKEHLKANDGKRIATLVEWLEKAGRIRREQSGSTYHLFLPSTTSALASMPKSERPVHTRTLDRSAANPTILDLSSLTYVPLPRAPAAWEARVARGTGDAAPGSAARFSTVSDHGWAIVSEKRLPVSERPDVAFKRIHVTDAGAYLVDPSRRAEGHQADRSVIQAQDRSGKVTIQRGLPHDIYRTGVNPLGQGIAFLSRECVVHAYDAQLRSILEVSLHDVPEIRACSRRLQIDPGELKNHVRCVAISADNSRWLVTVVDEAWCLSMHGEILWGLRVPVKEGWTRVSRRSDRVGTSPEIQQALVLMGLGFPVTLGDLNSRYRELAKRWHPDVNTGDSTSHERMQRLNAAVELLTGTDPASLSEIDVEGVQYEKSLFRKRVSVSGLGGIEISGGLIVSEKNAADWLYAANFAGTRGEVFLATYSGRVLQLSSDGSPRLAYDIGAVPRQIVGTENFRYILTDTRLYILEGERLHATLDVFDQGELVTGQTGFGLLEKGNFSWFTLDGVCLGSVKSKDPIRRVFSTAAALVVETRQYRAVVTGPPPWWSTPSSATEPG